MPEISKKYFDDQFDKLGQAIARGFDETNGNVKTLETKVDVIQGKLDNILYKEVTQLETRVNKIEKHLGFKPA